MSNPQTEFDSPWKDVIERYFPDFIQFFLPQAHGEIEWSPERFGYELWGSDVRFKFAVVKLLDYKQQWSSLETSRNPFATVVMAHLLAQQTRPDAQRRLASKLAITRGLYERGDEREDVINLFSFIDWVMSLPAELEQEFRQEIQQLEAERGMPYITSVERSGIRQGLLEGIELGLSLKFGAIGLAILPEISGLQDVEQLRAILSEIVRFGDSNYSFFINKAFPFSLF